MERLSRLAQLQLEMATQERMIDNYIDLLKTDRLDENTSSTNLEKGITYFQVVTLCVFLLKQVNGKF